MLAASWSRYGSGRLEFHLPGGAVPAGLAAIWRDFGVEICRHPARHPLAHRAPTYNKLLAIDAVPEQERLVLLDNDVILTGPPGALAGIGAGNVSASVADLARISPECLETLEAETGARLLRSPWSPWKEVSLARVAGRPAPRYEALYFNSGVVVFPEDETWPGLWHRRTRELSDFLAAHGLKDRAAVGSDQMSLSMAVGDFGAFEHLPPALHYKVFNFWEGHLPASGKGIFPRMRFRSSTSSRCGAMPRPCPRRIASISGRCCTNTGPISCWTRRC
ncbi:hypothetical protein [Pseudoroseicyclus aestuarii]|nr:hypothetical protein [Pseudoroseicyclus aestuarii]